MKPATFRVSLFLVVFSVNIATGLYAQMKPHFLVGTYTSSGSFGIYSFTYNPLNDEAFLQDSVHYSNPSFLAILPDGKHLVAVSEEKQGRIGLFEYERSAGKMKLINDVDAEAAHPCHVALSPGFDFAYIANYSSGNFSVFPLTGLQEKKIGAAIQNDTFKGKGKDTVRQKSSHVHMSLPTKNGQYIIVTNLGTDELYVYKVSKSLGHLKMFDKVKTFAGAGPRHIAFSLNEKYLYVMEELTGFVAVYSFKQGKLSLQQRIPALPKFDMGSPDGADIHVSPDGKNLYCTTRGNYNAISTFAIDSKSGKLTYVTHQSVMGKRPRNFLISPIGHNVLVANQGSNEIVCFYRNPQTGLLKDTGVRIKVPNPTCIVWAN